MSKSAPAGSVLCRSMADTVPIFNRLADPTTKLVIYDSETNGLDYKTCVVVGHVITFGPAPQDTYYVPVRHGGEGNVTIAKETSYAKPLSHPFEKKLAGHMLDPRIHWVGHHFMFDLRMLGNHGLRVAGRVECTQVNAAILDEFAPSYSLEASCIAMNTTPKLGKELYQHLAMKFGGEPSRAQMANFWKLSGSDMIGFDYVTGDGTSTWELYHSQVAEIERQQMDHIRKLESDITRVVYRMTTRGIRIDREALARQQEMVAAKLKEARKLLPENFSVRSPLEMKQILIANGITEDQWPRGEPTAKMIEKGITIGNPSFNEAFLRQSPIGRAVLVVRKYEHLENSFLTPMAERHLWPDGRLRATFNQTANDDFGTVTYRFSCNDPNLQQNHKRNQELGEISRAPFVPDEGDVWLDADLAQCEPRLLAHYSQAKVLVDGYLATPPVDAHSAVAMAAFGSAEGDARESGKRINQTLITGGGKAKIITMLGAEGAKLYDDYFRALPEIKDFQQSAKNVFKRRRYLVSLLRRRMRLKNSNEDYKAVNRILQTGNADVIKKGMVDIDAHYESTGDQCKLLNTVHDSLSSSVPDTREGREISEYGLRLMTDFGPGRTVELTIPQAADYAYGKNWAEATYNKKGRIMIGEKADDPWYAEHKRNA